ncbi:hypothetical protein [Limobrevibacterium gyesilva]|uniref:Uncharacterized protein n=1 Tax=Limobrevibacterium gyesilva TaxID=2991712 RepID=A0AA42CG54_9PROT|nr:hypothetical protein [Limobrevibacterium gyesilva]MCW3477798.1 hypothetical protein [Limobrevibacterium gyesilva]
MHTAAQQRVKAVMSGFTCHILMPEQASTVYPLVREAVPALDLRTWLRFAKRITNPRRASQEGIMVVRRNSRPMPCGLFVYRRENDLTHGPTLVAEHFIAVDVLDAEPAMRALVAELDTLAEALGCHAIRAMVLGQSSLVASGLRDAGHQPEGATLWKPLHRPHEAGG